MAAAAAMNQFHSLVASASALVSSDGTFAAILSNDAKRECETKKMTSAWKRRQRKKRVVLGIHRDDLLKARLPTLAPRQVPVPNRQQQSDPISCSMGHDIETRMLALESMVQEIHWYMAAQWQRPSMVQPGGLSSAGITSTDLARQCSAVRIIQDAWRAYSSRSKSRKQHEETWRAYSPPKTSETDETMKVMQAEIDKLQEKLQKAESEILPTSSRSTKKAVAFAKNVDILEVETIAESVSCPATPVAGRVTGDLETIAKSVSCPATPVVGRVTGNLEEALSDGQEQQQHCPPPGAKAVRAYFTDKMRPGGIETLLDDTLQFLDGFKLVGHNVPNDLARRSDGMSLVMRAWLADSASLERVMQAGSISMRTTTVQFVSVFADHSIKARAPVLAYIPRA
eukprot:CAMPEP_0172839684 /NCGR_PEP_ID=MMETSP1075-20121228/28743_1 /TAXON_ID=2916 /ORGANISM="Ceratium fusus, Strain PA161109" /LENGTH=397 /DNA_ID=CAMNT_0013683375 /DNA_START=67 /DNA_END=1260 /DNA_ORIENTATION=+